MNTLGSKLARASSILIRTLLVLALSLAAALGTAIAQKRVVAVQLQDGKASGAALTVAARGAPVLRLVQGDDVELQFLSDRVTTLHLHGYNIETRVVPDGAASIRFRARAAGRFPLETHGANGRHATLLYIEVHPK